MEDQDTNTSSGLLGFIGAYTAADMYMNDDFTVEGAKRGFNRAVKAYLLLALALLVVGLTVLVSSHLINSWQDRPYRAFEQCRAQITLEVTATAEEAACIKLYPGGTAKHQTDLNERHGYYAY